MAQVNTISDMGGEFDWLNNGMLTPTSDQGNGEGPSTLHEPRWEGVQVMQAGRQTFQEPCSDEWG